MTAIQNPWTDADQRESERHCAHEPDRETIGADDHAGDETLYLATCEKCGGAIETGYTTADPSMARWRGVR